MAQGFLLTDEVTGGFASHLLCDKEHTDNAGNDHQSHPQAVVNHNAEHSGNHDPRYQKLDKTLGDHLAQSIDIVGIMTHDIAVIMRVKISYRKSLHLIKHPLPEFHQGTLGNRSHHPVKRKGCDQRDQVKDQKGKHPPGDGSRNRSPVSRLPGFFHKGDNILLEYRRDRRYYRIDHYAHKNGRHHNRIKFKYCSDQPPCGSFFCCFLILHPDHLPYSVIHKLPGRSRRTS